MDQIKIGKFIQNKRKEVGLTQSELAEKLLISDRAISKWENGICMPDVGNIKELCKILKITINDLFSGEVVDMKDYEKKVESNLIELQKRNENYTKMLLFLEIVIGVFSSCILMGATFIVNIISMSNLYKTILIVSASLFFAVGILICLKIEKDAGYYECKKCHHKYIPTYNQILWALHSGRTRYMRCPECNKLSWQKKVTK